jgi:hypothetical protein
MVVNLVDLYICCHQFRAFWTVSVQQLSIVKPTTLRDLLEEYANVLIFFQMFRNFIYLCKQLKNGKTLHFLTCFVDNF